MAAMNDAKADTSGEASDERVRNRQRRRLLEQSRRNERLLPLKSSSARIGVV
jgi:hypothetical protein